jgi:hypothetical protein
MKLIVILVICLAFLSFSTLQAQSGWKKNAAGHDVYEYKSAKPQPYKQPVKKTTNTMAVPVKTEREPTVETKDEITVTDMKMTVKPVNDDLQSVLFPPYGMYTGGFNNDTHMRSGIGRMEVFDNGSFNGVYEGNWDNNKLDGTFTDLNRAVFKGVFIDLKADGDVTYYNYGNKIAGPLVNGKITGFWVVITYPDGSYYTGDVLENLRHGDGEIRSISARVLFSGKWAFDLKNGEGWEIIDDKTYKKGSWQLGKESGPFDILSIGSNSLVKTVQYDNGQIVKPGTKPKAVVPAKIITPKTVIKTATVPPALKPIRKDDKTYIPGAYAATVYASEGLGSVNINGKRGFVDKTDLLIIPLLYEEVGYFITSRVGVKLNGKWGFIDKEGKVIVPLIYKVVYDYTNGVAKGILPGETAFTYFDWDGKIITQ